MATNMRITNPQWPALREAARRILRLQNTCINIPLKYHSLTNEMINELAQKQPARIIFPQLREEQNISILLLSEEEQLNGEIVQISQVEPSANILWLKGDNDLWLDLIDACQELLAAGYPGCIGCGGPNSEEKWDEIQHRKLLL